MGTRPGSGLPASAVSKTARTLFTNAEFSRPPGRGSFSGGISPFSTIRRAVSQSLRSLRKDFASVKVCSVTSPFAFFSPWQRMQCSSRNARADFKSAEGTAALAATPADASRPSAPTIAAVNFMRPCMAERAGLVPATTASADALAAGGSVTSREWSPGIRHVSGSANLPAQDDAMLNPVAFRQMFL